jgi:hypothetical protein
MARGFPLAQASAFFLSAFKGSAAEYGAGLKFAIERGCFPSILPARNCTCESTPKIKTGCYPTHRTDAPTDPSRLDAFSFRID